MVELAKKKIIKAQRELTEEARYLQRAARERTFEYILTAFGLVAGLAWNDAVKTFIEAFFPLPQNTIVAKFLYALLMTLIVAWVSVSLRRIFTQAQEEKKEG